MKFLNTLERKIGRYAISGLMKYVVGCYIIGFILQYLFPQAIGYLTLEPYMIIHHLQIWRVVSWLLLPPGGGLIFAIIMIIFYYQIGTALEHTWGTFRFNVFMFSGVILTIAAAFVLYFATGQGYLAMLGSTFTTHYLNLSIFLAFAATYPEQQVLVYFLIPVKMKWLSIVYIILALVGAVTGGVVSIVAIAASVANVLWFFFATKNLPHISPKQMHRRAQFQRRAQQGAGSPFGSNPYSRQAPRGEAAAGAAWGSAEGGRRQQVISKHRCAICGKTELDDPTLEFRFCSKCNGNYEYCQHHLYTHKHVE